MQGLRVWMLINLEEVELSKNPILNWYMGWVLGSSYLG